jgi:transposase
MPAAYSEDLRERVVRAYLNGEGTYIELGIRFDVGSATVDRWVSRYRRTRSVSPDAMGGDRHSKFDAQSEEALRRMVLACPDATRKELTAALQQLGVPVSEAATQRALERLDLTRKKRRSTPPNATANA